MNSNENCGSPMVASKQLSQTERAFKMAQDNSRMLSDSISLLEEKLKPILSIPNPVQGEDCEEGESFVELAETIKKYSSGIAFANSRIRSLLERIEI